MTFLLLIFIDDFLHLSSKSYNNWRVFSTKKQMSKGLTRVKINSNCLMKQKILVDLSHVILSKSKCESRSIIYIRSVTKHLYKSVFYSIDSVIGFFLNSVTNPTEFWVTVKCPSPDSTRPSLNIRWDWWCRWPNKLIRGCDLMRFEPCTSDIFLNYNSTIFREWWSSQVLKTILLCGTLIYISRDFVKL